MSSDYYEVGVGRVEITPPLEVPYLAFYPRHTPFKGVNDPLYVRSIIISDGINEAIIISSDTIGFANTVLGEGRDFTSEVRHKIEEETGIPSGSIMLTSSHIHSTPDTLNFRPLMKDPGAACWLESLIESICLSVKIAISQKFRANLKLGKGSAEGFSYNRRGEDNLDNEVIVLLFEALDSKRNIIITSYSCHPVIMQVQELITADYVGVLQKSVKNCLKNIDECLFLQGACGDIDPKAGSTKDLKDVYLMGTAIAGEVMKIYGKIAASKYPVQPVKVGIVSETINLPSRPLPDENEISKLFSQMDELTEGGKHAAPKEKRMLEEQYYRIKEGDEPFPAEIQLIRLGETMLAGIPGEPFTRMGQLIKEECAPKTVIPVGYVNGYLGYIAPPEAWEKGGYEVSLGPWSKVGSKSFGLIIESVKKLNSSLFAND